MKNCNCGKVFSCSCGNMSSVWTSDRCGCGGGSRTCDRCENLRGGCGSAVNIDNGCVTVRTGLRCEHDHCNHGRRCGCDCDCD